MRARCAEKRAGIVVDCSVLSRLPARPELQAPRPPRQTPAVAVLIHHRCYYCGEQGVKEHSKFSNFLAHKMNDPWYKLP